MSDPRRATGATGEDLAVAYLLKQGFRLVERNWRCGMGELDVIARDGSTLVFVEVRTRRGNAHGSAEESITLSKQRRLQRLAEGYLQQLELKGKAWPGAWRIDVVAILLHAGGLASVNHIPNAIEGASL